MASEGMKDAYVTKGNADESPRGSPARILPQQHSLKSENLLDVEGVEPAGEPGRRMLLGGVYLPRPVVSL